MKIHAGRADSSRYFFKAIDTEFDTIVGYSGWFGPDERNEPTLPLAGGTGLKMPKFINDEIRSAVDKEYKIKRSNLLGGRKDIWC